jgi:hypothetical protein
VKIRAKIFGALTDLRGLPNPAAARMADPTFRPFVIR